jgi:hypothetical protein
VCWRGARLAKAKWPLSCDDRPGAVEWGRVVVGCPGKMKARKTSPATWDGLQVREKEKGRAVWRELAQEAAGNRIPLSIFMVCIKLK